MIVYRFRMVSDENDHFVRDYEVPSTLSLFELHEFITQTLDYDLLITTICKVDNKWELIEEFNCAQMNQMIDNPEQRLREMESVALCDVMEYMHDRLIYNFDLMNMRSFFLELVEAKEVEASDLYPRESFAHATPPDQYDADLNTDDGSIFDEMMSEFGDFDNDDADDDLY